MKLRKRLIALSMAAACAATSFAGAAFTDQSDIKVDDYVLTRMQELNIIKGYEDGSFKPNKIVTRAEMAKMIYVLRNGHDDASLYTNRELSCMPLSACFSRVRLAIEVTGERPAVGPGGFPRPRLTNTNDSHLHRLPEMRPRDASPALRAPWS